jgi:hypothetical protein
VIQDPNAPIKRQVSITDIAVGMRVSINARRSRNRGWVYHSDHRVISIHCFDSGALMCFVIEPWMGGEQQTVEARLILDAHSIEFPQPRMKEKNAR